MSDCIFCKIIRGEIPSYRVYEDEDTFAFLDIHPVNKGHVLVIPKEHIPNIFEISSNLWSRVNETVRKVSIAIEKAEGADGVNIRMNNREHAGQDVFHAHVHIIPRFKGDGLKHWPGKQYKEGEAETVQEKIKAVL